jgi:hypothetical protein
MRKTLALLLLAACAADPASGKNPFTEDMSDSGKEDSAYLNPDGTEVEVDLEGDVTGSSSELSDAPAQLGQFAMTYFRKNNTMYIESLAEDASAQGRAEWLVDGTWYAAKDVPSGAKLTHWRMRGLDAVLLFSAADHPKVGQTFTAPAPQNPFTVYDDAGKSCADDDDHLGLDQSIYWYRWEPDQASCKIAKQDLKVTISKTFSTSTSTVYPEYDQLVADKKLTVVVMFGEIDDGPITDSETGMQNFHTFGNNLVDGGYKKVTADLGERYEKVVGGVTVQIDLYSPKVFSGLDDFAHFGNFQKALAEHEVVTWDGHSMLGASDFWARPTYPHTYQIFLYGGCLGYEYYVRPILEGKGGTWANVDILSSVVEVSASANEFAAPAIAKLVYGLNHGYKSSWRSILLKVREGVGDSTFGVSGVRENCFTPSGSRCN